MTKHFIEIKDDTIYVHNNGDSWIKVIYLDYHKNYAFYVKTILPKVFTASKNRKDDKVRVYINENNDNLFCYDIINKGKNSEVKRVGVLDNFNFNQGITLITGHSGGGTSVVCKALRYRGVYFGDDSGDKSIRKAHEAQGIKLWLESLDDIKYVYDEKLKFLEIADTFKFKEDGINVFKVPNASEKVIKLNEIFPNLKLISVVKNKGNYYTTIEGEKFNTSSDDLIIKQQIFKVEGAPTFHLNFDKFFTNYQYFNKVLKFIGSENLLENIGELELLKKQIEFNQKIINNR